MLHDKFVEIVEPNISSRGNIIKREQLKLAVRNHESYVSMYNFKDDILEHVNAFVSKGMPPSVTGYAGECNFDYLWLDVDDKTGDADVRAKLSNVINETWRIVDYISMKYEVPVDMIPIYFSGYKGFHVGLSARLFGAEDYWSENLPHIMKTMVREIADNSPMLDTGIYNTTRIFRMPMSRNQKSGLYKVQVPSEMLKKADVDGILYKSSICDNSLDEPLQPPMYIPLLKALFRRCADACNERPDIFTATPKDKNNVAYNSTVFSIPKKGERNDGLFRMAIRLFGSTLKSNEVIDVVRMLSEYINALAYSTNQDQLSEFEIRSLINQAFKYTKAKSPDRTLAISSEDLASDVFRYAKESKYFKTFVPRWDFDLGGGFVTGNSYACIGKAGTMKSMLLQEMCYKNAYFDELDSIYINGEMSEAAYFERQYKMLYAGQSFIELVKDGSITQEHLNDIMYGMKRILKDRVHVLTKTGMSIKHIEELIDATENSSGRKMFACIIDSFSVLESSGNEVEAAIKNSLALKELAKKKGIVIVSLNHTNASCPWTEKDASGFVRGGSKIIDNADGYISLSKIIDEQRSQPGIFGDKIFIPGLVHARFVNKRDTGNTIDQLLKLNNEFKFEFYETTTGQ